MESPRTTVGIGAVLVALMAVLVAAWALPRLGSTGSVTGSCADIVVFRGQEYSGSAPVRMPHAGARLDPALKPPCLDPRHSGPGVPATSWTVYAVPGVDPSVAVMSHNTLFVRPDRTVRSEPLDVMMSSPSCSRDEELSGTVISIARSSPHPSAPPTALTLRVVAGSVLEDGRWQWVELEIATPEKLPGVGRLTPEADQVTVTVTCDGADFVATTISR